MYWLMFLINPARWVRSKTCSSLLVTLVTGLVIVYGFVLLLNPEEHFTAEIMKDDLVKLFITCVLVFASSLFFTRLGFLIEQKRRKGELSFQRANSDLIVEPGSSYSLHAQVMLDGTTVLIPGVSDPPPKYEDLSLDTRLPDYNDI